GRRSTACLPKGSGAMDVKRLDSRAVERVSGPAWEGLRDSFFSVSQTLLNVSAEAESELTTIYVKFRTKAGPLGKVFAVVWLKKSAELVVGLALPDGVQDDFLTQAPPAHKYPGLNAYFRIRPGEALPSPIKSWAKAAFDHVQE